LIIKPGRRIILVVNPYKFSKEELEGKDDVKKETIQKEKDLSERFKENKGLSMKSFFEAKCGNCKWFHKELIVTSADGIDAYEQECRKTSEFRNVSEDDLCGDYKKDNKKRSKK
jgi:hypothetical protein